jgi:regulator of sigma E protease
VSAIFSNGITLIIFALILGVLVFVHEFGHFFVSKRLGIPVLEFGFGFPPRALRFWRGNGWIELQGRRIMIPRDFKLPDNLNVGSRVTYKTKTENGLEVLAGLDVIDTESQGLALASPVQALDRGTEYTLNWIPLGGFVRMMGEEDPNVPGGFASAKPSIRAPILLAGVTMNLILAFVVFTFLAVAVPPYAPVQTTRLLSVAQDSPAAIAGLQTGDLLVAVNGQDIRDNYPALSSLLRENAGKTVTLTVIRNNRTLDPIQATPRANPPPRQGALGIALDGWTGLRVSSVAAGSVADRAGVRAGDVLVFIVDSKAGRPLKDQNELAQFVQDHPGWKIEWRIQRDSKLLDPITVQIPASLDPQNSTLGVNLQTSLLDAPRVSVNEIWGMVVSIPGVFRQLLSGSVPANSLVGPIGIAQVTGEVAQRAGLLGLLNLLGLLSVNLAVVNLLPFPALDGGRLIFALLEWVRGGKKIDPHKEGMVHLVGIMVLLGLMVIISFFDVQRLISGQSIFP